MGQEFAQLERFLHAQWICEEYRKLGRTELCHDLEAERAGHGRVGVAGDQHHPFGTMMATEARHGLKEGYAFGAEGGTIAGIFHVAADDGFGDVFDLESGADLKAGMGGIGPFAGFDGGFEERVQFGRIHEDGFA